MVKNLVFDFGKVLVDYDFPPFVRRCLGGDREAEARFLRIVTSPAFTERCDRGLTPFPLLVEECKRRHPDLAAAFQFFLDHYQDLVTGEVEGMRPLLSRLKGEGFRLFGLSNWGSPVRETMRRHAIFRLLDGWAVSCDEHLVKPETEFYISLCRRHGLRPAECLFTDDKAENVEGARRAGMRAVLFVSAARYALDLERELRA